MKRTLRNGLNGLFGLFITFLLIKAAAENDALRCYKSLNKTVGEDVTLDCNHTSQRNVTDKSIVWRFNETVFVLVYRSKGVSTQHKVKQFINRTSLDSSWNPSKGKLAVKISSVKMTDAGVYTCSVGTGSQTTFCSTTLHIQPSSPKSNQRDGNRISDPDVAGSNTGAIIWGTIATIGGIIIVAGIFFYIKKKPNENAEENQGTGEEMTGLRVDGDPNTPEAGASSVSESSV